MSGGQKSRQATLESSFGGLGSIHVSQIRAIPIIGRRIEWTHSAGENLEAFVDIKSSTCKEVRARVFS